MERLGPPPRGILPVKITVPDSLKQQLPDNRWGKLLSATPVAMTVVATLLAGLASSEMTKAQYDRALAAQLQSKAGDQWNLFQAKKLRGALQRTTIDLMAAGTDVAPLDRTVLGDASPATVQALTEGVLPKPPKAPDADPTISAALSALDARPESEINALVARIPSQALAEALENARARARAFDAVNQPIGSGIDRAEKQLAATPQRRSIAAARLRYSAARYDAEAQLNQAIASLYELQVRKGNLGAERHQRRSQEFFLGMLVAQAGVVVSTLAMAARQRNLLWSLAAGAGFFAVAFAGYVYLFG